jgi:tetrahydromethanopterin S-methyltransferase subunit E
MAAVVFSTDTDDSGQGLDGTIRNNAWKQAMASNINAVIGDWTTVAFSAGNFGASAGSWTVTSGQVLVNTYLYFNKMFFWHLNVSSSAVSTTPASLYAVTPMNGTGHILISNAMNHPVAFAADNGAVVPCVVRPVNTVSVEIVRADGTPFHASASTTAIVFSVWFQIS